MHGYLLEDIILGILTGIIGGLIAGLVVESIIRYKDGKRWKSVQKELVILLDTTLNGVITSIRVAVDMPLPNQLLFQHKKDEQNYLIAYFTKMLENLTDYRTKIEYLDSEHEKQLSYNLLQVNDSLLKLVGFFGSFEAANPWYVENILKLLDKVSSARLPYLTYPELGNPQHKDDKKLKGWRSLFFDDIHELLSFALQVKKNKLIRDVVDIKYL
jgi:hypothetical protein